jgi:hypothetical protein
MDLLNAVAAAFFVFEIRERQRYTRSAIGGSRSDSRSSRGDNFTSSGSSGIGSSNASGDIGGSGTSGTGSGRVQGAPSALSRGRFVLS